MKLYNEVRHRMGSRMPGFDYMFEFLKTVDNPLIVETGCARVENNFEYDGQSSLLFDDFINEHGGDFYTVDIAKESVDYCLEKVSKKTNVILGDSVIFLKQFNDNLLKEGRKIDLAYLDSFDAPADDPVLHLQSEIHHLYEFLTILPSLRPGSLVVTDDNLPAGDGITGKGRLLYNYMKHIGNMPVSFSNQIIWKF
jgi:hypothetical protein